ncbi:hypothetical protein [Elizabethkingia anophelis]|uniref:hypothetical protein n=1 Tax=Elizabethkingia anophelis TaxID=1117645 RepID=UPI003209B13C
MEITKENITSADLDFLNFIQENYKQMYGYEIYHFAETINRLLRDELYKISLFTEMDGLKSYYTKEHSEGYLKLIFEKIAQGCEEEITSIYIDVVMSRIEDISRLLNGMSRYFLEQQVAEDLQHQMTKV